MDFGASMFFTDYSMTPTALGRALEERGFESVGRPSTRISHCHASRLGLAVVTCQSAITIAWIRS